MNDAVDNADLDHVILARPQIGVMLNKHDEIVISTAFIGDDFRSVEHGEVVIPLCDAAEVIQAMQHLLAARS